MNFNQLPAVKKGVKNGASQQTIGPSYFDRALHQLSFRIPCQTQNSQSWNKIRSNPTLCIGHWQRWPFFEDGPWCTRPGLTSDLWTIWPFSAVIHCCFLYLRSHITFNSFFLRWSYSCCLISNVKHLFQWFFYYTLWFDFLGILHIAFCIFLYYKTLQDTFWELVSKQLFPFKNSSL